MMKRPLGRNFVTRLMGVIVGGAATAALLASGALAQEAVNVSSLLGLKAPVIFNSDFEDQEISLDKWIISGNSPTVAKSPVRRGGNAMKSFLDRANSPRSYRTEVAMRELRATPNEDYWYGFSIYLPSDYAADNIWEIVAQWHGVPDTHLGESDEFLNPPISLHSEKGEWMLSTIWDSRPVTHRDSYEGKQRYYFGPYRKGVWTDWVFHIKWSPTSTGVLEVWKDGKQVVKKNGPIGFNDVKGPYMKLGIYKGWKDRVSPAGNVKVRTLYHDEVRVAHGPTATYAHVAPGGRRPQPPGVTLKQ